MPLRFLMMKSPARLNEIITFLVELAATLSRIVEGHYRIICQCLLLAYKMYPKENNPALVAKLLALFHCACEYRHNSQSVLEQSR